MNRKTKNIIACIASPLVALAYVDSCHASRAAAMDTRPLDALCPLPAGWHYEVRYYADGTVLALEDGTLITVLPGETATLAFDLSGYAYYTTPVCKTIRVIGGADGMYTWVMQGAEA